MERMVALLRAVNVGGRKLPMAELRELCGEIGWSEVATYIQSGNVVFAAGENAPRAEQELEAAIVRKFGLGVAVMVRTRPQWAELAGSNPFPETGEREPNRLLLLVSKAPPHPDAADRLMERAQGGEQVLAAGGGLWFHYPAGVGTSKLSPALIDRLVGSPATARNFRTVLKLQEMLSP